MCTCTYIPAGEGFLFAANRDEAPARAGREVTVQKADKRLWYVREPRAGGTNLCADGAGRLACLLNGAENGILPAGPFRKSRGLVVLDSFLYPSAGEFYESYRLDGVNAFTLVVVQRTDISVISWDGARKSLAREDPEKPHIWASPLLYNDYWRQRRRLWFGAFLAAHPRPTPEDLFRFQMNAGDGNIENDLVMNRNNRVRTVSVSALELRKGRWRIRHKDIIRDTENRQAM